jgi:hypothetical protein
MTIAAPPSSPAVPVSKGQALQLARQAYSEIKTDAEIVILEDLTVEKDFGWVFFASPRKYLETKEPRYLVPGLGPLVVERTNGQTHFLATSVPPERAVEEFERRWRASRKQTMEDVPPLLRVAASVVEFDRSGGTRKASIVLSDGHRYVLSPELRAWAFWRRQLPKMVGDTTDAVCVEYEPDTRIARRLRLTQIWEGVQKGRALEGGRWAVSFRVSAALYYVRTDRPEFEAWKAILDEAAVTQKSVRVAKGDDYYELVFVGWSGPQRPQTDVARVKQFDRPADAAEATLLAESGRRFVAARRAPDFEIWCERIAQARTENLPLRVEYEPSTRQVVGILPVERRKVVRLSPALVSREREVWLEGDPSPFFLRKERLPLVYGIWGRDLGKAARSGEVQFIVTDPKTRDILLATRPY